MTVIFESLKNFKHTIIIIIIIPTELIIYDDSSLRELFNKSVALLK